MKRQLVCLTLCVGVVTLVSACATERFVREQVGAAETRLAQRLDTQETVLRQTADRTTENTRAIDSTCGRLQDVTSPIDPIESRVAGMDSRFGSIDTRVGEVGAVASDARKQADSVSAGLRNTETQVSQRFANRNYFLVLEEKSVYFDSNKSDLRETETAVLLEMVTALKANSNAVVELRGFADPRGAARDNYRLSRERVEAVARYLAQQHGIDLRRIHAAGMGQEDPVKGSTATFAKSRRVDIRLLATRS